jgi:hypothetical protein
MGTKSKIRVDHKDLRLAWKDRAEVELVSLLKNASIKTIRRAADELQARNPEDASTFRDWLSKRGVHLYAKGGAQPPAIGTTREYSTQSLARQLYIRLPVDILGKEKGDPVWVVFESKDSFRVYGCDPSLNDSSELIPSKEQMRKNGYKKKVTRLKRGTLTSPRLELT